MKKTLYIGWDVGGWNCERNANSRDALVILDAHRNLVGVPWRGNLRQTINNSTTTKDWIKALLACCHVEWRAQEAPDVVMAIDTPLGFPSAFQQLLSGKALVDAIEDSANNPYLYRYTERYLFEHGLAPLSAIKDMIGSQATKGIHTLAKFAPHCDTVGVWRDDQSLVAFEAYPSACKQSRILASLLTPYLAPQQSLSDQNPVTWQGHGLASMLDHDDKRDALICALLAWLYVNDRDKLELPDHNASLAEGWIFVPKDSLRKRDTPASPA